MIEQTQRRRQAVGTIHDIVSAMRAIAAGRIQGAQRALEAARQYHSTVLQAIALLLPEVAPTGSHSPRAAEPPQPATAPATLLVLTSEQPFCGPFNQDLISLTEARWHALKQQGPARLLVVGQRGLRQMIGRGLIPAGGEPAATSLKGILDLVKRLATLIHPPQAPPEPGSLRVIYNRYRSVSEQVPTEVQLLPLDLEQVRQSHATAAVRFQHHLARPDLLAGLIKEYAFISLYSLATESYTSEQASRLVAMDASTRNTERLLETLLDQERRERQGEVTRAVLELIGARFAAEV
jgi:F-type H+-transporting ATPase subunit gamma